MADDFIQRHYRYNFAANVLDGAFFTLGLAFFSSSTILPMYVRHLADSPWLISLIATIAQAGWFLPQLLTARRFNQLDRRLPFVMRMTAHERIPVLILGLSVLFWPRLPAAAALIVFFFLYIWQASGGGLTAPGWVDLIARVIPVNRRGRMLGATNLLGSLMGAAGAALAGFYLRAFAYPRAFAYIFLTGAACLLVSWVFLGCIREPQVESMAEERALRDYWRALPALLRSQPNLRRYLLARMPGILGLAANGFLAVYAAQHFNLPDQVAAGYTAALMIAGTVANPLLGLLGDRRGHKLVMEASLVAQGLSLLVALLAARPEWFYLVFVLQGFQNAGSVIAAVSITMEFGRPEDRPTLVALANTTQGLFFLVAPPLGALVASLWGYRAAFWAAMAAVGVAVLALRLIVYEPRHEVALEEARP